MSKPRLLLVEDDTALAELLQWHFEQEGYDVVRTPDGEEALLLSREAPPDIVLLDWMIEGLSGIEVCRRLRRATDTANVPIIMLTARGEAPAGASQASKPGASSRPRPACTAAAAR